MHSKVPYRTVIGQLHSRMLDILLAIDISLALPYSGASQILPEKDPLEDGCIKMDPQPNCMAAPHPGPLGCWICFPSSKHVTTFWPFQPLSVTILNLFRHCRDSR